MKPQKNKRKGPPRQRGPAGHGERSPIEDEKKEAIREDERSDRPADEDIEEHKIGRPVRLEH